KLADSFITALSFYFFYRLSARFLEHQNVSKSAVLFLSTFMFTILSLISTPDVPMILFWILCLLYLQKALFLDKKVHWISAGFFMGLAFDSKYTAVLLPGGLGLFLLISNTYRHYLFSKYFLGMLAVFSVTISPVIIWNFQHDFASFKFQSQGRMESMHGTKIDISNFAGFIGHQSAVLMPILFFALFYFLIREWRKFHPSKMSLDQQQLFLLSFFVPGFIAFFLLSIIYWVKLNWTMPAYLTGIIWVSRYFSHKWLRLQVLFSFLVHVALAIEIFFYPFPINSDDTWIGWKELAKQVKIRQNENPGCFVFSADDYKTSAMLHFYLNENVYSQNILGKPALQFDYVGTDLNLLSGQNALFINSDPDFMDNKD
ncbi:MAG TPA: glycosyltransferase family 39 protein, partial [Puia sp.]|nr:glycosyltransferase family 39 protein [Puia sp.]